MADEGPVRAHRALRPRHERDARRAEAAVHVRGVDGARDDGLAGRRLRRRPARPRTPGRSRPMSIATAPETSGASRTRRTLGSKPPGSICGVMSTGFTSAPKSGRWARSAARRSAGSGGTWRPAASAASAATTDGPPEMVRIATAVRAAAAPGGPRASRSRRTAPSVSSTATMPAAANAARYVSQAPAREPVCEPAARRPASARPPLSATTGFARAAGGPRDERPAVPDPLDEEPHHPRVGDRRQARRGTR